MRVADFGGSFVAAVSFDRPSRAKVLMSYGNASQAGSPHAGDQLPLLAAKEMRDAWRTRAEVEANLESRDIFSRSPPQSSGHHERRVRAPPVLSPAGYNPDCPLGRSSSSVAPLPAPRRARSAPSAVRAPHASARWRSARAGSCSG